MAEGGNAPVTKGGANRMSRQNLESLNSLQLSSGAKRPNLTSQQSNSLPSTPYARPRELSEGCRTPSPAIKNQEVASPRSARSESDGTLRAPGRTPYLAGCKYETGMAFSRRRMPYSLGADKLESSPTKVKKTLAPEDEKRLTADTQALYEQLLPSEEDESKRTRFVEKLEKILNGRWPGNSIKVHVFGSSGNLLCTSDSDVDICITTPMKALERVCLLARALAEHGMEKVVCVPQAKVPIVKIWDPELQLACDMNVNNTLALENTRMIRTYVRIDPRVRPLAMVIKHWTRRRILNDAALGGTLSSYTWICMIINFLQTRNPRILPSLQQRPHQKLLGADGNPSSFADDLESLKGFGKANWETLGELLFHFFRKYGYEMDYEKNVVSIREGGLITKESKNWHRLQLNRLCVEEPFNTDRNLGNTADDTSFRGVHQEIRRAFELLCRAKLDECCEQYVFPEKEEKVFSKPPPQPKPLLTRSHSQSGRSSKGGGGNRTNASSQKHRGGPSNRRASSAAALNKMPVPPPGNNPLHDRVSGRQIHDQLSQHYKLLKAQEAHLRLQMQQRAQMNAQANALPVPSLQMPPAVYPPQADLDGLRINSSIDPPPLSAPLRPVPGFHYPMPMMNAGGPTQSLSHSQASSQSGTNPPSPSMTPAGPSELRRGLHRSVTSDNNLATLRSHSQPPANMRQAQAPRVVPITAYNSPVPGQQLGFPSLHQFQQAYLQSRRPADMQCTSSNHSESPQFGNMRLDPSNDEHISRQYVGYFVTQNASRPHDEGGFPLSISSHADTGYGNRGFSPNLSRLRSHTSRSPSPSQVDLSRDRSISFYSAASAPSSSRLGRGNLNGQPGSSGPVIVDGSSDPLDWASPPEPTFFQPTASDATSLSDDLPLDTPGTTTEATPSHEPTDTMVMEPRAETRATTSPPNVLQFGEFPVTATMRNRQPRSEESKTPERTSPASSCTETQGDTRNGLGIEFSGPKTTEPQPAIPALSPPQAPSSSTVAGLNLASSLKPLPLLSPVREVRTPSPTAMRNNTSSVVEHQNKYLHGRSVSLSGKGKATASPLAESSPRESSEKGKEGETSAPTSNGIQAATRPENSPQSQVRPQTSAQSQGSPLPRLQTSSWQQSTGKKKKKGQKAGSMSGPSLSQDDRERKGG